MRQILTVTLVAALLASACGKSEEQKQIEKAADDLKKAGEAIGQAAAQAGTAAAAQSTADVAKAMSGMAAALGGKTADGKPVEPLPFQTLETALPSVSGWEMEKPRSERMTSPVAFSKTESEYKNGEQSVHVTITDTAAAGMLLMPVRMMVATGYSRETSDGYEKATTVSGQPAVEKWQTADKDGELTILAGDRFIVELRGRNVANVKTLHDFAAKTDLGKLK